MTDYIFSQYAGKTITGFDATKDVLILGSVTGGAAAVSVADDAAGDGTLTVGGQTVKLHGVSIKALATSNVNIVGSTLYLGDNTTDTSADDLGNTATGLVAAGNNRVYGFGGADTISFNTLTGNNVAFGGTGNDSITTGSGNDEIHGGADGDTITSAAQIAGNDTIFGDGGNDSIVIAKAAGNLFINGNAGDDAISIGATSGAGAGTIHGGQGNDTITVSTNDTGSNQIFGDLGNDSITTGSGADTVSGGDGDDVIVANGSAANGQNINGNAGSDTITDGAGADTIHGGQGNDSINTTADTKADVIHGDLGDDTITTAAGHTGADSIYGDAGNDSIVITTGANTDGVTASGGDGNDTISIGTGVAGTDVLYGNAGADQFNITLDAAGADTITIGDYTSADAIVLASPTGTLASVVTNSSINSSSITLATAGDKLILNTTGSDTIAATLNSVASIIGWNNSSTAVSLTGGLGADFLISYSGNDTLNDGGGTGLDYLTGGTGNNLFVLGNTAVGADETIIGGGGNDTLSIITGSGTVTHAGTHITGISDYVETGTGARTLTVAGTLVSAANGNNITASSTVTVDASTLTTGGLTFTTGSDAGVHLNVIGSAVADSLSVAGTTIAATISGGGGLDTLTGGSAADSIIGSAGGGSITGGAGSDTISLGTHTVADTILLDYSNGGTDVDSVTGFTANTAGLPGTADKFQFGIVALNTNGTSGINSGSATVLKFLDHATAGAIGAGASTYQEIAASGGTAVAAGADVFGLVGTTFANATAVATALEHGGARELTVSTTDADIVAHNSFIVAYSDGTDLHISSVEVITDPSTNGYFAANGSTGLTVHDLAVVHGVSSLTSAMLTSSDFAFV